MMDKKTQNKIEKLGISEEIESIIANCECGEITKATIEDISKMRKWEIQDYIGNYLDSDKYADEFCCECKQMKTFCKAFGIEENEIAYYFAEAISEGGYEIAYAINENVVLVLE